MKNLSLSSPHFYGRFTSFTLALLLTACSSAPDPVASRSTNYPEPNQGRYSQNKDSIPLRLPTEQEMQDPDPSVEQLSRGGNKPYNIYGVDYSPRTDVLEYAETGTASWYGNKFHGHLTSNGEVYNVFSMTAAHKTLPLPSYVRVTNLDNHRTAIVRVNDRGPFHDGRVIDLSYSAAYKLGIFQTGTGRVKVELVSSPAMVNQNSFATAIAREPMIPQERSTNGTPQRSDQFIERPYSPTGAGATSTAAAIPAYQPSRATTSTPSAATSGSGGQGCFIQLIASSDRDKVQRLGNEISAQLSVPTAVETANGLFRLLAGPLQQTDLARTLQTLQTGAYPNAYITNKKLCG